MATAPTKEPTTNDNRPALVTTADLARDFAHISEGVSNALAGAQEVPAVFEDEDDISLARERVKALMGERKRAEATREDTKRPYLDAERVVQSFFATKVEEIDKAKAEIERRAKVYLDLKAKRERDQREAEARRQREEERKRDAEAAEARRKADEARREEEAAAERARKAQREAEEREERELAAARKREAAATAAEQEAVRRQEAEARQTRERQAAEDRRVAQAEQDAAKRQRETLEREERQREEDARAASARANQATRDAEVKPADLARTRTSEGGMATLAQTFDFEVTDYDVLDLETLRPHLVRKDVEKAIGAFVRTHKDKGVLRGVRIFATTKAQLS